MSQYLGKDDRTWVPVNVRGTMMDRCVLWDKGLDIASTLFRMVEGCVIRKHTHLQWVQVVVLEGEMQIESDTDGIVRITAGGCYVLAPGDSHTETSIQPTVVLVTQLNRHPNYLGAAVEAAPMRQP